MEPFFHNDQFTLHVGDAAAVLRALPAESVGCVITSPPYWGLRDYGVDGQIGLESTPEEYVARLVAVFEEVRRVLVDEGTLWINLGDSYAGGGCGARDPERWPKQQRNDHMPKHQKKRSGLKQKDLVGIPWMVAFALRSAGWFLRADIIWHKPNPMPESVIDRPTKAHEYLFLLAKSDRYFYDAEAIKERSTGRSSGNGFVRPERVSIGGRGSEEQWTGGEKRNRRSVWTVTPQPFEGAHFATMPPDLVEPCVLAGSKPGDVVLDPFNGAGTTGVVATRHGRRYVGIELKQAYAELSRDRLLDATAQRSLFGGVA